MKYSYIVTEKAVLKIDSKKISDLIEMYISPLAIKEGYQYETHVEMINDLKNVIK